MKKDLLSYKEHDAQIIETHDVEYLKGIIQRFKNNNTFEVAGFKKAFSIPHEAKTHIDIGSGGGWLIIETSKIFDEVIGIEPSETAVRNVEKLIEEMGLKNIKLINKDMIDGMNELKPTKPVFFTTSIVLSHIKDYYVKEFLKIVNDAPIGSALYFVENYDKNIQQRLWHIRRKYWWAKNLPEWQLEFFEIKDGNYFSGIYGKKVCKNNVNNKYSPTTKDNIFWIIDGIKQKILGAKRVIIRLVRKLI
ncbi:MAG: hypothetical protein WC827_02200 [Candidatus Paceibacterota bacterium]|jgi:hypothetical protein